METLLDLSISIVSQPTILVSLIALLELVLQEEKFPNVAQRTLRTFAGFLVLIDGVGLLANSLAPFTGMFQTALNTQGVAPSNEAVVAIASQQYGTPTALIMLVGMVVNILLVHFTHFKYIFLTDQVMVYVSCLTAVILVGAGSGVSLSVILSGGLSKGILLTVTPAPYQPSMKQITGDDKVAIGHTGNIGYTTSDFIGKVFGNKEGLTEDIKIPKGFGSLGDSIISVMVLMLIVYVILVLLAETGYVEHELSNGENAVISPLIQAGASTAGFVVILQGVRMVLGEIASVFQGIARKLVPNFKPAPDVPVILPCAPNAVLIRFSINLIAGTISMLAMVGLNTTMAIPDIIRRFLCGTTTGVFGNSTGGRQGAILGAVFNSLLVSWLPLFILSVLGDLQLVFSTFAGTDHLIPGLSLDKLGEVDPSLLVGGIVASVVVILLASAVLTMREKEVAEED